MRQLTTTVAGVKNVIVRFFLVFSLLVYSFAAVAVLIFNGNISDDYDPNDDDGFDVLDPKAQLNTMDQCLLALFQIAVTNNWQDIMFINIVDGQTVDMWGSLFFIIYFVVVVWFGTNIMGAVVIEAYVTAVDRRDLEKKEKLKTPNFLFYFCIFCLINCCGTNQHLFRQTFWKNLLIIRIRNNKI